MNKAQLTFVLENLSFLNIRQVRHYLFQRYDMVDIYQVNKEVIAERLLDVTPADEVLDLIMEICA